jgi:hypothetical protein
MDRVNLNPIKLNHYSIDSDQFLIVEIMLISNNDLKLTYLHF